MPSTELRTPIAVTLPQPVVAPQTDFDTRWAAWIARGLAHEQRVKRKSLVAAGLLATGAAVAYAFFR